MTTKLVVLASILVATAAIASAAEAGGGVRLGFGGPLGTFTATPAHGGGAYSAPRKKVKRKSPALEARAARTPRVAKAVPSQVSKPDKSGEPQADEAAPVTGSSALIQGDIPADEPAAGIEDQPAPDVAAQATSPEAEQPVAAKDTNDAAPESSGCTKFIPAVGMTVPVGCDD